MTQSRPAVRTTLARLRSRSLVAAQGDRQNMVYCLVSSPTSARLKQEKPA